MHKKYLPVVLIFLIGTITSYSSNNISDKQHKAAAVKLMRIFDSGNVDELDAIVADNIIEHQFDTLITKKTGLAGVKEIFSYFHKVFPDTKTTIYSIGIAGDTLFVYNSSTGTATQEFMSVKPHQKHTFTGIDAFRFDGDKVVEHWGFIDAGDIQNTMSAPMPSESSMMNKNK